MYFSSTLIQINELKYYSDQLNPIIEEKEKYSYENILNSIKNNEKIKFAKLYFNNSNLNHIDENKVLRKLDGEEVKLNADETAIFNVADNYSSITTTDGVSLITKDEFIKRLRGFGMEKEYTDLINKLTNGEVFTFDDQVKLIQMQKNFYYSYKYL